LIDIRFFRELAANSVQPRPADGAGSRTIDVSIVNIQNASFPSAVAQNVDASSWKSNLDDQDGTIQIADIDLDFFWAQHIRVSRISSKEQTSNRSGWRPIFLTYVHGLF
jgi:hypothetical protein